tara:strand:+ start:605 stop:1375 length:771 start_codon:yes stop_codon:yes gene_type:complete
MDDQTIKERTKLFMAELQQIGGITLVSNKPYINQKGLQHLAKKQGVQSQKTTLVQWACNPEKGFWVVQAEIVDATGATHTGLGDASPNNVGTNIKSATLRMAETRAINRTLRRVLRGPGVADTSAEEIPGVGDSADPDLPAGPVDQKTAELPWDPTWKEDAKEFMQIAREICLNNGMETLTDISRDELKTNSGLMDYVVLFVKHNMPGTDKRPSQMNRKERAELLDQLRSTAGEMYENIVCENRIGREPMRREPLR